MKKRRQFHYTGLLRSSKLVHLDVKNLTFLDLKFSTEFNELSPKF